MSRPNIRQIAPRIALLAGVSLLAACGGMYPPSQSAPPAVAYNPPNAAIAALPATEVNRFHVNFATGSDRFSDTGQSAINGAAAAMQANPALIATVTGASDSVGGDDSNMQLSRRRAMAVHNALLQTGLVTENRIDTHWTGQRLANGVPTTRVAGVSDRSVEIALH